MRLSPPANLTDFDRAADPATMHNAWDSLIGSQMDTRAMNAPRFFHPLKPPTNAPTIEADPLNWTGFPKAIEIFAGALADPSKRPEAYRLAEVLQPIFYVAVNGRLDFARDRTRFPLATKPWVNGGPDLGAEDVILQERQQDEYLEWHVTRKAGKVERIMFTAEGPEYWRILARDSGLLTALYNELLFDGRNVVAAQDLYWPHDLAVPSYTARRVNGMVSITLDRDAAGAPIYLQFPVKDSYNQFNRWNTVEGCVHLIQRNNSLGAEINLAADATYDYGPIAGFADAEAFMTCAAIGGIRRNSDPNIAFDANIAVSGGTAVTIADPVGLYISEFLTGGITHNGDNVTDEVLGGIRGTQGGERQRVVRFEIRAPQDGRFTLEDCTFDGQPITSGGPIARTTSIAIYADAQVSARPNVSRECFASFLCEHPDRAGFKAFPVQGGCAKVPWADREPYTGEATQPPAPSNGLANGMMGGLSPADGRREVPGVLAMAETRREEPGA